MIWTIQLLGKLAAQGPQGRVRRFRTQKSASLLAYLAFHPAPQPRESLIELLWPDCATEAGRHNLSMALSFLRHQLEPPGVPSGIVIHADRSSVQINHAAVSVDAIEFESNLTRAGLNGTPAAEQISLLLATSEKYQGRLLPGFYDDWIVGEATRLENQYVDSLVRLADLLLEAGEPVSSMSFAQKAVDTSPLSEAAMRCLMRALVESGKHPEALKAFQAWELRLQKELGARPPMELQVLASDLRKGSLGSKRYTHSDGSEAIAELRANLPTALAAQAGSGTEWVNLRNRLVGPEFLLRTTTRFFGRCEEVERLTQMLGSARCRLIVLTGTGGAGKTRLALEVAAQAVGNKASSGMSAVFVSLGPITDPDRIYGEVLRALGIVASAGDEALEQLASVLDARASTLLVLDNFEQFGTEGAFRVRDLLARSGSVTILVTSRQRLLVEGEREFGLSPLPIASDDQSLEEMLSVPSIALFVDRAQAVQPDFQLTRGNASVIATLCSALEGLPLAIELAAARVGSYSPPRILKEVEADRLEFLTSRRRDAISRHKTLRATLSWSYHLLPGPAQAFLSGLSVFRGGWTQDSAAAVCSIKVEAALELLAQLLDNSLIRVVDHEDGIRFEILETIRQYAWERLDESGQTGDICHRHLEYYAALAKRAGSELTGPSKSAWINRLQTEHDNLCAAIEWGELDNQCGQSALKLVASIWPFWEIRGFLGLGRRYLTRALECTCSQPHIPERGKALHGIGVLALCQGDYDSAQSHLSESLRVCEDLCDIHGMANAIDGLGRLAVVQGNNQTAVPLHARSLGIYRELGDQARVAGALYNLAFAKIWWRPEDAKPLLEESLAIRTQLGDRRGVAQSLASLGYLAFVQGDYDGSESWIQGSLEIRQELGDKVGTAQSLDSLGSIAGSKGELSKGRKMFEECLQIRKDIGDRDGIAHAFYGLGVISQRDGDLVTALEYLEASLKIYRQTGGQFLIHALGHIGHVARDAGEFDRARASYHESLNLRVSRGDVLAIAQSLEDLATLYARQSHMDLAARLLGAADSIYRDGHNVPAAPEDQYRITTEAAKLALGDDVFLATWEVGRAMTIDQCVDYALHAKPGNPSTS